MDEFGALGEIVGAIGFPISCCVWMATYGRKAMEKLATSNDNLAEAIKALGEAERKHSVLLEKIEIKIDRMSDKLERHAEMFIEYKTKMEHIKDLQQERMTKK